jgi:hypothetical protein
MVSFGDLLTLLLCFFIAIVAFHRHGSSQIPANDVPDTGNHEEKIDAGHFYQQDPSDGTPLALLPVSSPGTVLRLEPADFGGQEEQMTDEAEHWFRTAIKSEDYSLTAVRLEVCGNTSPGREDTGWYLSMRRALAMRRQLVDAGFALEGFEIELLGPDCSKLESKGGKKTVAALTLKTKRVIHG